MSHTEIVTIDPEIMSGAPVFCGTRVPIQNLLDYLKAGDSIDEFLDGFPTVRNEDSIRSKIIGSAVRPDSSIVASNHRRQLPLFA